MNFFKFLVALEKGKKNDLDVPVEEQRDFLYLFPEPKDDFDRSYFQYKCYYRLFPKVSVVVYSLVSFFAIPLFICVWWIKGLFVKNKMAVDAIADCGEMPEIIPQILNEEFDIKFDPWNAGFSLKTFDLPFVLKIISKRPLSPILNFKSIAKVAKYSTMIIRFSPKAIIVHAEYSFTSSILTNYCHTRGVEHINVMHGEKWYYFNDSFFHFDRCYVWDKHYVDLFTDLRAERNQFIVAIPPSLIIDTKSNFNKDSFADYKYYLAIYDEGKLTQIIKNMRRLVPEGINLKFRPHPRYSNLSLLEELVPAAEIEYPTQVGILESLASAGYVVSESSTVSTQAYFSGIPVIMDDVTDRELFRKLKERRYMMANDGIQRLSNYI